LRVARTELGRRAGRHPITGPELDDLAYQSADDAVLAITTKLGEFRGESRFTTWAYNFAVLEVSSKLGRHFWQRPAVALDAGDWERLPDRFGVSPADHAERHELIAAVRRAVEEELTERQRRIFIAIVVDGIRWMLVVQLGSSRNALSTRRCSTRGVSCGPRWPLTVTWTLPARRQVPITRMRGEHDRLG
jgi:RNA polymerase sigma-70 factor, ECF subfamily